LKKDQKYTYTAAYKEFHMTEETPVQAEVPPEPANDSASPEAITRALQALLEEKDKELAAMKDQALRALAEAENTRRRSERELADMSKYAVTGFARDLVSVLENLQRALDSIPEDLISAQPAVGNLYTGVEMTLKELIGIFSRQGIQPCYQHTACC
jgi:molecular chaperone GrpE